MPAPPVNRRTVLWAIPVSDLAGVARHVLDVVGVGIPGWRMVILCPPGPLADALGSLDVEIVVRPFGPEAGTYRSLRVLRDEIRRHRPDVVHSHLSHADLIAAMAVVGTPTAWITTEHGVAADDALYNANALRARAMVLAHHTRMRRLDGQIAVSRSTLATLRAKWSPSPTIRSVVIPNGIDPVDDETGARSVERHAPGLRMGSICRLAPEKGLDTLIDAAAAVIGSHPDAHLTVAGTGPLAGDLAGRAATLGIADSVSFPGYVDATELLADLDVVVQLSAWENCSYALLDALRAGCGVVATDVGGNPEILPESALVHRSPAAGVDPDSVARSIVEQGLDPEHRPRLDPSWPTVAEMTARIADFYDEVLTSRSGRAPSSTDTARRTG
ncbi:MAG: glycosyltransferase family 4 protein [Actinobacteria bacterium]|nr:glycosyltransferase family 4 protein [Actinomycetota bacterium]